MNKEYILNFLTTHKQELQNNYALTKIGLFGSYAKDTANENSDKVTTEDEIKFLDKLS